MKSILYPAASLLLAVQGAAAVAQPTMSPPSPATSSTAPSPSTASAPANAPAQGSPADGEAADALPTDAATYVVKAGSGDLWEIESSKALLAKSKSAQVRRFAEMMIKHHGQSTEKIKAAAAAARVAVPPPSLDAAQQKMLAEIQAANAEGIDMVYLAHQKEAHDAALALHSNFADNGDAESLKTAAREITPVVEAHRAELARMTAKA